MSLPLRIRLYSFVFGALAGKPVMQQPAEKIRAASNKQLRAARAPGAWLVIGRTHPGASAQDSSMTLPDGTVLPLRIYRPRAGTPGPRAVVVNFHGGGWVSGDARQSEWWASSVAALADVVVVSVDYRLAPEHPFPAAVEDSYAGLCWVAEHADELGVDAGRLAVMGDSAGGNLAAVVSLMSRDRGGPAIALQVLLYPSVELVGDFPSALENATAPVLTKKDMDNVPALYFRGSTAERTDPYASPLRAKHNDLPPALIQTAQFDPLRDQGSAYAAVLREAGVPVRLSNYVEAVHGYISLPGVVPAARQALGEAVAVIRDELGVHTPA